MRFIDWFSGYGGFSLALERVGHTCVGACEIDPFVRRVYLARFAHAHREGFWFPDDIRSVKAKHVPKADLWTAGFPCTDVSVAGKRAGIMADRTGTVWRLLELAERKQPRWLLLENVPGLLSGRDDDGEDEAADAPGEPGDARGDAGARGRVEAAAAGSASWFGSLLGALADLGYVGAWRVLDARWFGVPQRRRRVFLLAGRAGAGDPGALLLDPEGGRRNPPARQPPGTHVAGALAARLGSAGADDNAGQANWLVPVGIGGGAEHAHAVSGQGTRFGSGRAGQDTYVAAYNVHAAESGAKARHAYPTEHARSLDRTGGFAAQQGGTLVAASVFVKRRRAHSADDAETWEARDTAPTLAPHDNTGPVRATALAFAFNSKAESGKGGNGYTEDGTPPLRVCDVPAVGEVAPTLRGFGHGWQGQHNDDAAAAGVLRRLTPTEAERLQGLPDGWTCTETWAAERPYSTMACSCPDSPRYEALGNGVAIPVVEWIARRLPR